jgi:hypothetical protein
MKVSDCCGAEPYSNGDSSTEDYGICPECKEHCEYIELDDEEPSSEQNVQASVATEVEKSSEADNQIQSSK